MTYRVFIFFFFLLLGSCNNKMEFKRVESESSNSAPGYQDVFLVANFPKNPVLRDSLLVEFAKKAMPNFCSLDADVDSYAIYFLESTSCTRNFDERNKGEYTSLAMDDEGCPEDKLPVSFYYRRSETNPKSWYLFYPEIPADTIYCE